MILDGSSAPFCTQCVFKLETTERSELISNLRLHLHHSQLTSLLIYIQYGNIAIDTFHASFSKAYNTNISVMKVMEVCGVAARFQ